MSATRTQKYKWIGLAVLAACLLFAYLLIDPEETPWMPQCIFHRLTGLNCPGCGSQRAIHALLHGEIAEAIRFNALLVCMLPLLAFMTYLELVRTKRPRLYASFYRTTTIVVLGVILAAWFIARNLLSI